MKMTKDVRIHLIGGESIDVDCSSFAGDTLDVFIDSVIYELLDQEYMRINHLVIPAKNVLYVECLEAECDCNVMNSTKHVESVEFVGEDRFEIGDDIKFIGNHDDVALYVGSESLGTITVDEINRLQKASLIGI